MQKLVSRLPVLVFIAVACVHVFWVHHDKLTPWRGGGFGMFATHQSHQDRGLLLIGTDTRGVKHKLMVSKQALRDKKIDENILYALKSRPAQKSFEKISRYLMSWEYVNAGRKELKALESIKNDEPGHIDLDPFEKEPQSYLRPIQSRDVIPKNQAIRKLVSVYLSVWNLDIDRRTQKVYWKLVREHEAKS